MPRMLCDIVRDVAAQDASLEVVGEIAAAPDLAEAVRPYDAEVVVTAAGAAAEGAIAALLEARPRTRVVTIADDGAQTVVYRLSPEAIALGDLSPARLLEAMRP